jgi:hypothetical protein
MCIYRAAAALTCHTTLVRLLQQRTDLSLQGHCLSMRQLEFRSRPIPWAQHSDLHGLERPLLGEVIFHSALSGSDLPVAAGRRPPRGPWVRSGRSREKHLGLPQLSLVQSKSLATWKQRTSPQRSGPVFAH